MHWPLLPRREPTSSEPRLKEWLFRQRGLDVRESGTTQSALQAILLHLYGSLNMDAVRRSRIGDWLFERAYLGYKLLLEAGPIGRLAMYVAPGSWAIDVGANIGVFTIPFAKFVSGGSVLALEPEVANFAALQRRIKTAGFSHVVSAYCAVAAECDGTLHLAINPNHPGDHKLADEGAPVTAWRLDTLVKHHGTPPVSLIKVDVQGAELRVLKGAAETIERCRPALLIEVDEHALRRQGASVLELLEWLNGRGYAAYRFDRNRAPVALGNEELLRYTNYIDVLFLPSERHG